MTFKDKFDLLVEKAAQYNNKSSKHAQQQLYLSRDNETSREDIKFAVKIARINLSQTSLLEEFITFCRSFYKRGQNASSHQSHSDYNHNSKQSTKEMIDFFQSEIDSLNKDLEVFRQKAVNKFGEL